jgi:pyruvate/2-oxoglutarate dehydrogenase complex dihydrolipoamide dehydrogenase (E3) component
MPETLQPDICVIGAGSGGLSVAAAAAAFGAPVVLVERGRMGGDCLNYGCVPSKSLLAAAKRAAAFTRASDFGVTGGSPTIDFAKVRSHVRDVIAAIAPNDSTERFTGLGVRVIAGTAQFKDAATVAVGDAFEIKARRFVIATGSSPAIPPIPGLADTPHVTNETIFDLDQCPAHLLVIGGGPIGLELAQAFRRLGAAVTVLEAAVPLAKDDPECAAVVLDQLARDGVAIRAGVAVRRVAGGNGKVQVVIGGADQEETISWSRPAAPPMWRTSGSTAPASSSTRAASWSTSGCAPPTRGSMRSATWRAACSSPMSPTTMRGWWCGMRCFGCPSRRATTRSPG